MKREHIPLSRCRRRSSSLIATLLVLVLVLESCNSERGPAPVERLEPISPIQTVVASPAPAAAPAQAAVTQASWTPDALEELLAPIALYPDQLLGQILAASINSQEVLDAGNWLIQNERSEEHTSELQSQSNLVCRLLLEKKNSRDQ